MNSTDDRPDLAYPEGLDPKTLDAQYVMQTYGRAPVTFVRGEGTLLYDDTGKEYLDFLTGLAVTSLGHAHPEVAEAISAQASKLLHVSNLYYNEHQPHVARGARQPPRGRRPRVLREQRRRGQRVRDQARPPLRPAARRTRAVPCGERLRVVPRPHPRDARSHWPAAEAGDVPATAGRLPPSGVRRGRRDRPGAV